MTPHSPWGKDCKLLNCPLFIHSICYWYIYRHFVRGRRRLFGRIFQNEKFLRMGKFLGPDFAEKIPHGGNLPELLNEIPFIFYILFGNSTLHVEI